jgi:AbrB family looped-hinge helix DNA binding protein
MKYDSRIGQRGQIVIPKPIRDNLGLNKSSSMEVELKGRVILLKEKDDMAAFEAALKKYRGSLRKRFLAKGYKSVDQYLDEMRGRDETRER